MGPHTPPRPMRLACLALAAALFSPPPAAQPAAAQPAPAPTAYVGGRWYDGERFLPRDTTWAARGVFVAERPEGPARVVELGGAYVVPPFADAHLHALDDPAWLRAQDSLLVARGVLRVLNPHVPQAERASVRGLGVRVSVAYAVAGVTAPGAHPAAGYEARALGLQAWDVWGPRGDEIRAGRLREGDAYHLATTLADVDALWPRVLASGTRVLKVTLNHSEEWDAGAPAAPRGLAPAVVAELTRRAHAAGLRVVAHVETAADVRAALDAGVDALAHVPGYAYDDGDPRDAPASPYVLSDGLVARLAASGVPVTPTLARGPLSRRFLPPAARPDSAAQAGVDAFHRRLLRRLQDAGVALALGADSGGLWAWDEAAYWVRAGLTPAEVLRAWAVTTPRMVAPELGPPLAVGAEASLLALACDPTADWACTERIRARELRGRPLRAAPPPPLVPRMHDGAAATAYVGGRWYDGERFVPRDTTWAERGVFVARRPARVGRTVELGGRFVVPPFGDAHTHQLSGARSIGIAARYREEGVFYALVLTNPTRSARAVRDTFAGPGSIDVAYAHGGLTSTESHPHGVYEGLALGAYTRQQQRDMAAEIRAGRQQERNAYWFMDTLADVDAEWEAYLQTEPDVVKVYVMGVSDPDAQPTDRRGLRPPVVREIVRRAHAAGLPVWAHVETGADVALAEAAGADGLAHLPGYSYARDSARYVIPEATVRAMGARRMAVAPTASLLPRYTGDAPERRRRGQAHQVRTLRQLHAAGARVVIGVDSWGSTSTPEAAYLASLGVFPLPTLLRLWSETTPQAIFPGRAIGRLAAGYEASLLALACDPTADWACTARVELREKQGAALPAAGGAASGAAE